MTDPMGRLVPPPVAPAAHLDDAEIAGLSRRANSDKHLADCAWCRSRLARFEASDGHEGLSELLADLAEEPISEDTLKAATQWTMPVRLASLLGTEPAAAPEVAAGQLWRLSWRGAQVLVVIVRRDGWSVRVMPVTTDVALADEYSLLLDDSDSSLGSAVAVFGRAGANVPVFTLSRFLGDVTVGGASIRSAVGALDAACIRGRRAGPDASTGPDLRPNDWEAHELLDSLQEQMQWFSSAVTDVPEFSAAEDLDAEDAVVDIREALVAAARAKVDVKELSERAGIGIGRLVDLLGGRSQPSGDESAALSAALGRTVVSGLPPAARTALIEVVSEPAVRAFRSRYNEQTDPSVDPGSVALLVSRMWEEGLAARASSGSGSDANDGWRQRWRARLAYLQAHS